MEEHGAGYIMNRKKIIEMADVISQEINIRKLKNSMKDATLKTWQKEVVKMLEEQDDRVILFVVDPVGGRGKTFLSKWLMVMKDAERFGNGKSADIKYMYQGSEYVVFDYCRSQLDHINYEVLEDIKNGVFNSTKYESKKKVYDVPKMIVFMNQYPDTDKLSFDRFNYYNGDFED